MAKGLRQGVGEVQVKTVITFFFDFFLNLGNGLLFHHKISGF